MGLFQRFANAVHHQVNAWTNPWNTYLNYSSQMPADTTPLQSYAGDRLIINEEGPLISIATAPLFNHTFTGMSARFPLPASPGPRQHLHTATSKADALKWLDEFMAKAPLNGPQRQAFEDWKTKVTQPMVAPAPSPLIPPF